MKDRDAQLMVERMYPEAQWDGYPGDLRADPTSNDPSVTNKQITSPFSQTQRPVVTDPDYKGGHDDLSKIMGYVLDLTTQKLAPINGQAVMTMTKNLKPVDSEGGVTYAYDNFIVVIPNPKS